MRDSAAGAAGPSLPGPISPTQIGSPLAKGIVKTGYFSNVYESRNNCGLRTLHIQTNQWKIGKKRWVCEGILYTPKILLPILVLSR